MHKVLYSLQLGQPEHGWRYFMARLGIAVSVLLDEYAGRKLKVEIGKTLTLLYTWCARICHTGTITIHPWKTAEGKAARLAVGQAGATRQCAGSDSSSSNYRTRTCKICTYVCKYVACVCLAIAERLYVCVDVCVSLYIYKIRTNVRYDDIYACRFVCLRMFVAWCAVVCMHECVVLSVLYV